MTQIIPSHFERTNRRLKRRKRIAHRLLIELLASQFAFPVRWIETQDVLFSNENAILRFIEIGPAKVLSRMATQTANSKYAERDLAKSVQRKFLSSKADDKEICYEYDPVEEEHEITTSHTEPASCPTPTTSAPAEQPKPNVPIPVAAQVPDVPVSAQEIIRAHIARKFNKALDEIPVEKSIKDLSSGKSTLQNELVGILEAEFPNLPALPEDLPILQLSKEIQQSFSGRLGKESSRLLSRFISAKLPASFAQNDVRSYLEQIWGVGSGRQTSVLLLAVTAEPASRLLSADSTKRFFDSLVMRYATITGTNLSKAAESGAQQQNKTALVGSKQIDALREEQNERLSKHFKSLAEDFGSGASNEFKTHESEVSEKKARSKLGHWSSEFEDDFEAGIQPIFDPRKIRRFNSWWNNVRQDIIKLYHEMQGSDGLINESTLDQKILHIANRSDDFVCKLVDYLGNSGLRAPLTDTDAFQAVSTKLSAIVKKAKDNDPIAKFSRHIMAPETIVDETGTIQYKEVPRHSNSSITYPRLLRHEFSATNGNQARPFVDVQTKSGNEWRFNPSKTETLLEAFDEGGTSGISYTGKVILVTGAGPKSIASKVLRGLLMGGARVIVTSSRPPAETKDFFQSLYAEYGARGSELTVLPFNQGSKRDCAALIDHIYGESGLNQSLDVIIPFAAISERAEIDGIDGRSELAHRLMLTNVIRLLGDIVRNKHARDMNTRPTQVLLPLSPNHGVFGGDGLYAESKLGLEGLLSRFQSETWSDYLHICGAVIGWTRGTDLMGDNDILAQAIETHGALTFSQSEMAFNLLALMAEPVAQMCEYESILVNLNGGLDAVPDLKDVIIKARNDLNQTSSIRKAILAEDALESATLEGTEESNTSSKQMNHSAKRSTIRVGYPSLPNFDKEITPLQDLEGMVDLSSVPVIVGFSELGPWGSARTRWEMESQGTFSQEAYIEMAWIMNYIKHFDGEMDGKHYAGWIDSKTGVMVQDHQVGEFYGQQILEHSGIRLVEPKLFGGYDPNKKEYLHEVVIEENLPEFSASQAVAEAFKLHHGENVSIRDIEGSEDVKVQIKRGASLMVSKAVPFEGSVAGQIPSGWDPTKYGLPEDIVRQVDPVTAYALCCAAEALYSAGISDASEMLQHIHISEVGNFIGSMMGGISKTRNMYRDRYLDKDVQGDVMQETYLNTTAAWINMLLLGTAGPIKTPTGACATGIESIDNACESLLSGKTRLCFVGGTDDFQEEESYAFRTMKATVDANDEFAKGRLASEMSRPTSDTRSGFVEAQGSGVQIIATADIALSLGLPIYGVIASSTMAGDKISRSVPAPGQGVLSFARQTPEASQSPLLDMVYRRREMKVAIERVHGWRTTSLFEAYQNANRHRPIDQGADARQKSKAERIDQGLSLPSTVSAINRSADTQINQIRRLWGNDFRRQDPDISPLRASLATWGLTIDDIDFVSLHGTSTKANDKNEPDILNKQMNHLNRTVGNPLLAICQKSLTGHPKAPAASFMLNGCLQALDTGLIPGNRNADNVEPQLSTFTNLTFPTRPIQTKSLKAFSLTSFGFGQKGGQLIGIHPRYLFAAIGRASYQGYSTRVTNRTRLCHRAYLQAMLENRIVACKATPQYTTEDQDAVLLNPVSRMSVKTSEGESWRFVTAKEEADQCEIDPHGEAEPSTPEYDDTLRSPGSHSDTCVSLASSGLNLGSEMTEMKTWLKNNSGSVGHNKNVSVGINAEDILSPEASSLEGTFAQRNYTAEERAIISRSADPRRAMTGRWCAKDAVFRSLGLASQGAGAAMKDIEVLVGKDGAPVVKVSPVGHALPQHY